MSLAAYIPSSFPSPQGSSDSLEKHQVLICFSSLGTSPEPVAQRFSEAMLHSNRVGTTREEASQGFRHGVTKHLCSWIAFSKLMDKC